MKTVTSFGYPLTTTDFSSIAARLAASPADIILNMGYPGDGLALAKLFATQSKPKQKIVIMAGSDAGAVTGQLATQANGGLFGGDITPSVKGLPASFTTFYNALPGQVPHRAQLAGAGRVYLGSVHRGRDEQGEVHHSGGRDQGAAPGHADAQHGQYLPRPGDAVVRTPTAC